VYTCTHVYTHVPMCLIVSDCVCVSVCVCVSLCVCLIVCVSHCVCVCMSLFSLPTNVLRCLALIEKLPACQCLSPCEDTLPYPSQAHQSSCTSSHIIYMSCAYSTICTHAIDLHTCGCCSIPGSRNPGVYSLSGGRLDTATLSHPCICHPRPCLFLA
jgi:hypothetical protein